MLKLLWVLILVNVFLHSTSATTFNLTEITAKNKTVEVGDDLEIFCKVTDYFRFCNFFHDDKNCTFEWQKKIFNLTNYHCPLGDFNGNYLNTTCGIKVSNVTKEHAGNWTCQLEERLEGGLKESIVSGSIAIDVVENKVSWK